MYEPTTPELVRVKSRISTDSWRRRVEQAQRDEMVLRKILDAEASGTSLNEAMAKVLPANRRRWARRRIPGYRTQGFEALIDSRKQARARGGLVEVIELPLAGSELLAAAETETGGIAALTDAVVKLAEQAIAASAGQTPAKDLERRNANGPFTDRYNRARSRRSSPRACRRSS